MANSTPAGPSGDLIPAPRDDLCLAFANTRYWRGSDPVTETLHTLDDLLGWAASSGGDNPERIERFRKGWRGRADEASAAFAEAIAIRELIFRIFGATAATSEPAASDIGVLNAALARAPQRSHVQRSDSGFVWRTERQMSVASLLAPQLWSAGDLLTGARLARVRQCANERCLWLFLDDSKSANRRWCSMSACGNRAKAHRHYLKQKHG